MIQANMVVDAKGLSCPMPIVRTKKAMDGLEPGHVLEVLATDKGSKADIKAWAENTGHQYLGTVEEGAVLKHYLRKANHEEKKEENKFPYVVTNEELAEKINSGENIVVLDVREPAEYAFGHIPSAISIPFGQLEERVSELDANAMIYVVCRTGSRSDFAAQKLAEKGFKHVRNVVPGMSKWMGAIETL
ncbi:MAG: sulfurtransferase TusA family protein [Ectobacillus sp.]